MKTQKYLIPLLVLLMAGCTFQEKAESNVKTNFKLVGEGEVTKFYKYEPGQEVSKIEKSEIGTTLRTKQDILIDNLNSVIEKNSQAFEDGYRFFKTNDALNSEQIKKLVEKVKNSDNKIVVERILLESRALKDMRPDFAHTLGQMYTQLSNTDRTIARLLKEENISFQEFAVSRNTPKYSKQWNSILKTTLYNYISFYYSVLNYPEIKSNPEKALKIKKEFDTDLNSMMTNLKNQSIDLSWVAGKDKLYDGLFGGGK